MPKVAIGKTVLTGAKTEVRHNVPIREDILKRFVAFYGQGLKFKPLFRKDKEGNILVGKDGRPKYVPTNARLPMYRSLEHFLDILLSELENAKPDKDGVYSISIKWTEE